MRALVIVCGATAALAGCGDNAAAPDAALAIDAASAACTVAFSGNFAESSRGGSDCAQLAGGGSADVTLGFAIPSRTLASSLIVAIDLGATPAPGTYSPEIVDPWSAQVVSAVNSACVYSAGTTATPTGDFQLALSAIDARAGVAHGTLVLHAYVHAFVLTTCGASPTEDVAIAF